MTASERAAGELVADVDMLAAAVVRIMLANTDATPRKLAEALVAAGFGNIAAARREALLDLANDIDSDGYGWTSVRDAERFKKRLRDRAHQIGRDS